MKLLPDWKMILKKAWSIRLNVLAGTFSILEVVLPLYSDAFPRGTFAAMSAFTVVGSMASRIVQQRSMHGG